MKEATTKKSSGWSSKGWQTRSGWSHYRKALQKMCPDQETPPREGEEGGSVEGSKAPRSLPLHDPPGRLPLTLSAKNSPNCPGVGRTTLRNPRHPMCRGKLPTFPLDGVGMAKKGNHTLQDAGTILASNGSPKGEHRDCRSRGKMHRRGGSVQILHSLNAVEQQPV